MSGSPCFEEGRRGGSNLNVGMASLHLTHYVLPRCHFPTLTNWWWAVKMEKTTLPRELRSQPLGGTEGGSWWRCWGRLAGTSLWRLSACPASRDRGQSAGPPGWGNTWEWCRTGSAALPHSNISEIEENLSLPVNHCSALLCTVKDWINQLMFSWFPTVQCPPPGLVW